MATLNCTSEDGQVLNLVPGATCPGFREKGRYEFSAAGPGTYHLVIDDALIPPSRHDPEPSWQWEPGFYAGEVLAELLDAREHVIARYRLDVAPHASKLGREAFVRMADDLFDFEPALLLGTESARYDVGQEGSFTDTHLAYARLRLYGADLVSSLARIRHGAITRLKRERALRPPHRVRRIDHHTIRNALRNPASVTLLRPADGTAASGAALTHFDVPHSYDDLDNAANRAITAAAMGVIRHARQVATRLTAIAASEGASETRTPLADRIPGRRRYLENLAGQLGGILKNPPFSHVSRPGFSAAGLNAISAHPVYARAFRYCRSTLRIGVGGESRPDWTWLSPTWEIYERWCFLQVLRTLQDVHPGASWRAVNPSARHDRLAWRGVGPRGETTVWLQPRAPAGDMPPSHGFQSISGERCPDIVVTLDTHQHRRFIVFDAKYRTTRSSVLDAMASAHVYRDSLRWKQTPPSAAILLVPRGGGAGWLEAPEFHRSNGVGVMQLGNEADRMELARAIGALLK